jgi:hypothetical protein
MSEPEDSVAEQENQHFVPQFYFRKFSNDCRSICALLTSSGRTIPRASIKGQCARKNFYGSKELESLFSTLENNHSGAIRRVISVANEASSPDLTGEELYHFFQAILFQRSRTALEIDKSASATGKLALEMYKHHLLGVGDPESTEILNAINAGYVTVTENPSATVVRQVSIGLENTLAITDLDLCLLRNRTDYPFIFSDAPVIFYNSYCRNVRNRGVLGMQCPGLQIFYPLNPWTLAVLFDGDKYNVPFDGRLQYDLYERSDVSQLNALQLHHSLDAVYFAEPQDIPYVHDLWSAHKPWLKSIQDQLIVGADFLIDGERPDGELIQFFEPQLELDLSLSFMSCQPIAEVDYVYSPRSPSIWMELRQREKREERRERRRESRRASGFNQEKTEEEVLPTHERGTVVREGNQPCLCNSGKKFKHCCKTSVSPAR